ncbi:MAG TPA: multicopper oxidase domain-containing protein [Vicinamibacterales bacterium]|jgi:nitrite reductase (NO-forming)|nr:multicopper oxidase domain-containing protein [Vicinamibacterales bacterium]
MRRVVGRTCRRLAVAAALGILAAACAGPRPGGPLADAGPFRAPDLPTLQGQAVTCSGPRDKSFALEARETVVDLGMGFKVNAWTYNGQLPGPVIEACEGDRVSITLTNHAGTSHGLDSHALAADMMHFGPVAPGRSLTIQKTVDVPGVFMYHCAAGPVTDLHIKSGLNGAMIVYPRRTRLRTARELAIVESGVYGERGPDGIIRGADPARTQRNDPALMMFNGRLEHTSLPVAPGELVRAYIVNVGPGVAAIHVMGTLLDAVSDGSAVVRGVQTYGIVPGSGAIVEFRIPEPGMYGLVDHDRLAYVPFGMVISFDARPPAN